MAAAHSNKGRLIFSGVALLCGFLAGTSIKAQTPAAPSGEHSEHAAPAAPARVNVNPDEVVLMVGDRKMTAGEFETLIQNLPPQYADSLRVLGKKGFADQYAYLLAMAAEGEKLKIDQREDFRQMLAFQRLLALAQTALNEIATKSVVVTADDVKAYYSSHQSDFEEAKLRGIYVAFDAPGAPESQPSASGAAQKSNRTEADAQAKAEALRSRIQKGEDIAKLAQTESDHPTASQGGDFGYVRHNQFAPQIDNAVFALAPQQVSAPLRDRFGFFIFTVESKRVEPLEQVQQAIENKLRQDKVVGILEQVRKEHPVTFNPRYFPDAPPSIPGSQPQPQ